MNETKHTELPFSISEDDRDDDVCTIVNADGDVAEYVFQDAAEFIVRACNSHAALLAALEDAVAVLSGADLNKSALTAALINARAAIALATGSTAKGGAK